MKNADMPAMPIITSNGINSLGLTKREHFAAMAMQGIVSNSQLMISIIESNGMKTLDIDSHIKTMAYGLADKMLEEKQS